MNWRGRPIVIHIGTHFINKPWHLLPRRWSVGSTIQKDRTVAKVTRAAIDLIYSETLNLTD
jgi:hypothetical protein